MALIEVAGTPAEVQEVVVKAAGRDEIQAVREELDVYYDTMKGFQNMELGEVMRHLAAFSARASELRARLNRSESRLYQSLRTKEIEPFLEEVDRQFKIWSRLQSIMQMDWDMAKGFG